MSVVIDENGQQWERCSLCGDFVKYENLYYIRPSEKHKYGLDACRGCYVNHNANKPLYENVVKH